MRSGEHRTHLAVSGNYNLRKTDEPEVRKNVPGRPPAMVYETRLGGTDRGVTRPIGPGNVIICKNPDRPCCAATQLGSTKEGCFKRRATEVGCRREFSPQQRHALWSLEGLPIQARPIGWGARSVKWIRRHPRSTAAGALISVLDTIPNNVTQGQIYDTSNRRRLPGFAGLIRRWSKPESLARCSASSSQ
jgi:hypothetical protein